MENENRKNIWRICGQSRVWKSYYILLFGGTMAYVKFDTWLKNKAASHRGNFDGTGLAKHKIQEWGGRWKTGYPNQQWSLKDR